MTVDLLKFAKRLALVAGVSMVCTSGAYAQLSGTTTAATAAHIVRPITVAKDTDMNFGNIIADTLAAGTVVLDLANGVTYPNAPQPPGQAAGTKASAAFTVSGELGFTYVLTFPNATESLIGPATSVPMVLDGYTSSLDASGGVGTLDATLGTQAIRVGGTLHVHAAQLAGDYNGTITVTVAYN